MKFIKKIQNSDDRTKKFWLVVLSGASMAVIVLVWSIYAKSNIAQINPAPADSNALAQEKSSESGHGFQETLLAGLKAVTGKIKDLVGQKNNFAISDLERNFVLENLPKVPKTPLP